MERERAKAILLPELIRLIPKVIERNYQEMLARGGDCAKYVHEYGVEVMALNRHTLERLFYALFAPEEEYERFKSELEKEAAVQGVAAIRQGIPVNVVMAAITGMRICLFELVAETLLRVQNQVLSVSAYGIFCRLNEVMALRCQHFIHTYFSQQEEQMDHLHEQKISVIGHMAAGMAHELRNPLTSFQGFLKLMEESIRQDSMDSASFLAYIRICQDELKGLQELLSNFLIMARKQETAKKEVNVLGLKPIMQRIHDVSRHFAIEKDVNLRFGQMDDSICVRGVASYIEQVGLNILKNAVDAVSVGGQVNVEVLTDPDERVVRICFADNGAGMERDQLAHIFDPFYTTKEKGTGLGLAICRQLVTEMGGTIHVESQPGKGTRVIVELPRVEGRAQQ
ncbi:MAG: HAMP domain-containing histidine kinase [Brevibacillus sp.]|nr:HAMP domain-containing histidine kinase [Brevibacillus sp.]